MISSKKDMKKSYLEKFDEIVSGKADQEERSRSMNLQHGKRQG